MQSVKSWESLKICIGPFTEEVAKRLGRNKFTIYKWTEPSEDFTDSGKLNPIDRTEHIIETALSHGIKRPNALAPLDYLEQRFGRIAIDVPTPFGCHMAVTKQLLASIEEFASLTHEVSKDLADGKIDPHEAKRIRREGYHAMQAIGQLIARVEEAVKQ